MILRYSVLRLLIFFGSLALLWLLGLRSHDALPWLVVGSAVLSMVISAIVLRPMRDQYIADVSERLARRRAGGAGVDEQFEDAAADAVDPSEASHDEQADEQESQAGADQQGDQAHQSNAPEEYR